MIVPVTHTSFVRLLPASLSRVAGDRKVEMDDREGEDQADDRLVVGDAGPTTTFEVYVEVISVSLTVCSRSRVELHPSLEKPWRW